MLRVRLLTATAAVALFAGSSALAQEVMTPPAPTAQTAPATPIPAVATPAAPAQVAAPAVTNTVIDVLKADGQFTTLVSALDAAQLTETLRSQGAISIFAPTDAAFAALPEADRTRLMDPANVNELRQLLLYHVVVADVNSSQIKGTKGGVQTAATTQVQLDGTGDAIKVDGATVTTADIDASNGAIFAIDQVLSPAASQVAVGDAEEAMVPTPSPPTAPADETDAVAPPAGEAEEIMTPPAAAPTPPAATTANRPAAPGTNAPNGQPAATTTTVAAPPVPNPTDGQVDDEDMDADAAPAPAPAPKPKPQA